MVRIPFRTLPGTATGRASGVATSGGVRSITSSKLSIEKHLTGFLTGGGVHIEIPEEYLGTGGSLTVCLGDTVAHTGGGLDYELEVCDRCRDGRCYSFFPSP